MNTLAIAVCAGCAVGGARAQDGGGWVPIGDPAPRGGHVMVYDSGRGVAVLFGGQLSAAQSSGTNTFNSETWEFDGRRWRFRTLEGPGPRSNAAMAYDSDRGVTVLFGGQVLVNGQGTMGHDTWEWDGRSWTLRSQSGPSGRYGAAMGYDPARHQTVLYGGLGGANDLWTWDGAAWTLVPPISPTPGSAGPMAWDPTRGALVMTGGATWAWDGTQWAYITSSGAWPIAFDPARGRLVAIQRLTVTFTYELTPTGWVQVSGLDHLYGVAAQLIDHAAAGRLMTFGADPLLADRSVVTGYDLTPSGWAARTSAPQPPGPYDPAMAFDSARGVCVVFGGAAANYQNTGETWELRGETWMKRAASGPTARQGAGMAYDPERGVSVMRGGPAEQTTWEWDGRVWTAHPGLGPSATESSMAFDAARGRIAIVGASGFASYDGTAWTWPPVGPGFGTPALAYDPVRGVSVEVGDTSLIGTYGFNGQGTTLIVAGQGTGRWRPSAGYSPFLGGVLCFGGFEGPSPWYATFPNSTYFLGSTATAWTDLGVRGPTARKFATMAYDSLAERLVMFGGSDHVGYYRETYRWSQGSVGLALQPVGTTGIVGRPASLFLVAKGGGWLEYQWRKGGVPLEDDGRITGTHRDTLVFASVQAGDAGLYDCIVSSPGGSVTSAAADLRVSACYANCDLSTGSPALSVLDFVCFLNAFAAGDGYANCDQSTAAPTLNVLDFTCFLNAYAGGCP